MLEKKKYFQAFVGHCEGFFASWGIVQMKFERYKSTNAVKRNSFKLTKQQPRFEVVALFYLIEQEYEITNFRCVIMHNIVQFGYSIRFIV